MRWLRRSFARLCRLRHSRGFGVQSPTDYRFVCYVINEHDPYYMYEDLASRLPSLSAERRKLCELYFRLSNYCQAAHFIDICPPDHVYAEYVRSACRRTKVWTVGSVDAKIRLGEPGRSVFVRASWHEGIDEMLVRLLGQVAPGSVLVLEGIKEGRAERMLWSRLTAHPAVGASYDLYDCGIIIADNRRYKKNYIINF